MRRVVRTLSSLFPSSGTSLTFGRTSWRGAEKISSQRTNIRSFNYPAGHSSPSLFKPSTLCVSGEKHKSPIKLSDMPILASLAEDFKHSFSVPEMNRTLLVASQHLQNTTPTLFNACTTIGFQPDNIFILGKYYSTIPSVQRDLESPKFHVITDVTARRCGAYQAAFNAAVSRLWEEVNQRVEKHNITNIVILSDGSNCLGAIPPDIESRLKVIGIEQTTYGLNHPDLTGLSFPIISVASCATKRYLELPIIIHEIMASLQKHYGSFTNIRFGLVGMGHLGSALARHFSQSGYAYKAYDKDPTKLTLANIPEHARASLLPSLVYNSDVIISATGTDITSDMSVFEETSGKIDLVSVSSGDYEFTELLRHIQKTHKKDSNPPHVLSDLNYVTRFGGQITVLRGGYPINFNGQMEQSPEKEIQLTRALLLAAVIQARTAQKIDTDWLSEGTFLQLSPSLQQRIAQDWLAQSDLANRHIDEALKTNFTDLQWIKDQSGGNGSCDLFASSRTDFNHNSIKKI